MIKEKTEKHFKLVATHDCMDGASSRAPSFKALDVSRCNVKTKNQKDRRGAHFA